MAQKTIYTGKDRGGRRAVTYRDSAGRTTTATVVGPGSVSGVKLYDPVRRRTIDNVALRSTHAKQTNRALNTI